MTEGSKVQEERRRQILQAALRAFARKGYHACRVSDIATEASDPELARVLVREVTRSSQVQHETDEIDLAYQALQRIIERGQQTGEFRSDVDARLTSTIWYGALEEILTGWAFGQLPESEEDVTQAERAVVEIIAGGLAADRAAAPA